MSDIPINPLSNVPPEFRNLSPEEWKYILENNLHPLSSENTIPPQYGRVTPDIKQPPQEQPESDTSAGLGLGIDNQLNLLGLSTSRSEIERPVASGLETDKHNLSSRSKPSVNQADSTSPSQSVSLKNLAASKPIFSSFDIPIGRGSELEHELKSIEEQLKANKKILAIDKVNRENQGGKNLVLGHITTNIENREEDIRELEKEKRSLTEESRLQSRFETEMCAFGLLRQELSIASGFAPILNKDLLTLAVKIYPEIFDRRSVMLSGMPSLLAEQLPNMETIDEEIEHLEEISSEYSKATLLQRRLESLYAVKQTKQQQQSFPHEPPFEFFSDEIDLPQFSDNPISMHTLNMGSGQLLRITVLKTSSADNEEKANDAIVLRESYDSENLRMTRMAITYFQPWRLGQSNLSEYPKIANAAHRLRSRLCDFCKNKKYLKKTGEFRLPSCMIFMRFYDETEQLEDQLKARSLLHIPLCRALDTGLLSGSHKNSPDANKQLQTCSIPDWMFGELFKKEMIGSNWIRKEFLKFIYTFLNEDKPNNIGFIIHSQLYRHENKNQGSKNVES